MFELARAQIEHNPKPKHKLGKGLVNPHVSGKRNARRVRTHPVLVFGVFPLISGVTVFREVGYLWGYGIPWNGVFWGYGNP